MPRDPAATGRSLRLRGQAGWAGLALSVAVYAAVSATLHQPFHLMGMRLRYFDLRIYHLSALRLVHGGSLYGSPMLHGLGFTYPPFAALVLAPLAWLPWIVDEYGVTVLNLALLVWALRRALMIAGPPECAERSAGPRTRGRAWSRAAAIAAVALWLEPVSVGLGYGQIDLLITALVVFDLSRPDDARTKGIAIGLAAAIKLTPLLFIAYLLLSRRSRAAAVAALTFAASIAVSLLAAPRDAARYWTHTVFQTSRIGNAMTPMDQSLHGAIARLAGTSQLTPAEQLLVVAIAAAGLALAVRASRRGDEALGFSLAALSALLASPISWSHHWTLAVPALVMLARRAYAARSRPLAVAATALGLVGFAYLPELADSHFGAVRGMGSLLLTDPYPLAAVCVLAACAGSPVAVALRRRRAQRATGSWVLAPPAPMPRTAAGVAGVAGSVGRAAARLGASARMGS